MSEKSLSDNPIVVIVGVLGGLAGVIAVVLPFFQKPPENVPQRQSIGWIRLGAVNHESATLRNGSLLIETTQPITVSPPYVPTDGTQVMTIIGVNLRKNPPTPPLYDPDREEKTSVLNQPTKLTVLKKVTFVDPKRPSTTVVWGEVALSEN